VPGNVLETVGVRPGNARGLGVRDDGAGEGMLRRALHRGGQREQLGLVESDGDDVGDLGLALGDGAGLVHHDGVDPGRGLQRLDATQ
jgi:hypothetical protein